MKYWYDTEFYEDGRQIHLISIGIVAEDGREFYLENGEFDWAIVPAKHWLWENVKPHLRGGIYSVSKQTIAGLVEGFITNGQTDFDNQLWGYYSAYDHVVLAQLFGRMVDMPRGVPWFTMDIKQLKTMLEDEGWDEYEFPAQEEQEHHALNDAHWNRIAYNDIMKFAHGEGDW